MVAATAADVRDVLVEGESGLLEIAPPWERPTYEPSKRRVTWRNGSQATLFSADVPGRLRGPQYHWAVADELAVWRYTEAWDMLQLGVRLGSDPRIVVATTPRPTQIVRELIADGTTAVTRGNTYANRANLAPRFLERIRAQYEGTRLGRQEIEGELLEDTPGALWTLSQIDALRVRNLNLLPEMQRVVVGVDPSATAAGDEAGIIVAGLGDDGHGYVLADASLQASPDGWARAAVAAYRANDADRIVAEVNNGGEMVQLTIRTVDPAVSYKAVHASRGKRTRAEPVAALYEQGRVHHVGAFAKLEDEMCTWSALENDPSPNRMDALVWALTELMLNRNAGRAARSYQG
jgi:phage terminase large subunit-like protein